MAPNLDLGQTVPTGAAAQWAAAMSPPNRISLYEHCAQALAQGHVLPLEQMAQLLGLHEAALVRLSAFAYPLSAPQPALQLLFRDLLLVVKDRAAATDFPTALGQVSAAAANPGPELLAQFATVNGVTPSA